MTELYAIFHKPTGKYMPARMFKVHKSGWSWWEPTGENGLGGFDPEIPRLFKNRLAAKRAMNYWLKGNYVLRRDDYFDEAFGYLKNTAPTNPRKPEDVEIHVITLVVTRTI